MTVSDIYIKDTDSEYADSSKVGYDSTIPTVRNIYLQANFIKFGMGVFTQVSQQPGKTNSQDHNNLLSFGDFTGFDNPTIVIRGIIDLNQYNTVSGAGPTLTSGDLIITMKLLIQIAKCGHIFTIYDYFNSATTTPIYRTHGLTGTFPNETLAPMKVQCTGLQVESNTQVIEGAKLLYNLNFVEVRS